MSQDTEYTKLISNDSDQMLLHLKSVGFEGLEPKRVAYWLENFKDDNKRIFELYQGKQKEAYESNKRAEVLHSWKNDLEHSRYCRNWVTAVLFIGLVAALITRGM